MESVTNAASQWVTYTFSCPTCRRPGAGYFRRDSVALKAAYAKESALTGIRWSVCPDCGPIPSDATAEDVRLVISIEG